MPDRYDEERGPSRGPAGWDDARVDERDRHRGDGGFHRDRTDIFNHNRDRLDYDRERERGVPARGGDEIRSWSGDEGAQRRRPNDEQRDRDARNWAPDHRSWSSGEQRTASLGRDWSTGHPESLSGGRGRSSFRDDTNRSQWNGFEPNRPANEGDRHRSGYFDSSMGYASASTATGNLNPLTPRGAYAGRGPKNYQRSDERIREDVVDRLTEDDRVDASDIDVRVQNGEVTLTGKVHNRSMRRAAEECIENLPGVRDVHNELTLDQSNRGGIGEPGLPQERDDITSLNLSGAQSQASPDRGPESRKR